MDGAAIGYLGAVDPRVVARTRSPATCISASSTWTRCRNIARRDIGRLRGFRRRIATSRSIVEVDISAGDLEATYRVDARRSLHQCGRVFDEYRGPQVGQGRKSLAVRVTLQRRDATITDEEADAAMQHLLRSLRERFGAELRA